MERFTVTKEVQFDAGHRVPLHTSKCRNPHGHRYRVVAEVAGPLVQDGSSTGMVYDFGHLKALLTAHAHDVYDHAFIVQADDPLRHALAQASRADDEFNPWKLVVVTWAPTAENLAASIHHDLEVGLLGHDVTLLSTTVWETPTSSATYRRRP